MCCQRLPSSFFLVLEAYGCWSRPTDFNQGRESRSRELQLWPTVDFIHEAYLIVSGSSRSLAWRGSHQPPRERTVSEAQVCVSKIAVEGAVFGRSPAVSASLRRACEWQKVLPGATRGAAGALLVNEVKEPLKSEAQHNGQHRTRKQMSAQTSQRQASEIREAVLALSLCFC